MSVEQIPAEVAITRRFGLLRRVLRNPLGTISIVIIVLLLIVAALAPWITPFSPNLVKLGLTNAPPFVTEFFLGGDRAGRDILSRLIAGASGAVQSAVVMTSVAAIIGVPGGLVAGYFGKVADAVTSWIAYILIALPGIVILIVLYTVIGTSPVVAMAVFGVMSAPSFFRLVRNLVISVKNELYVDAARVSGLSNLRIIGRHVLAAVRAPIIIMAAFMAGAAIGIQAGLEFLGLGDPSVPTWGGMLSEAFNNIHVAPVQLLWPGLAIGLTIGALVLLANALRDALEGTEVAPSRRARRRVGERVRAIVRGRDESQESVIDPTPVPDDDSGLILSIRDLRIAYPTASAASIVVDGVNLDLRQGEILGLVGESGSGKTQTAFSVLGLLPDEAVVASGSIRFEGRETVGMPEAQMARLRGAAIGYVPQEPMSNLDPSFRVGQQLVYGIRAQVGCSRAEARGRALELLERVGIPDPPRTFRAYPHEISGGMAQRVLIAGAVACNPRLLIADEPTTALDVTVQAEILDLLRDLQQERQMTVILVTHNFGVVADICERVAVMQHGRIVEHGSVRDIFARPKHPYTRMLLDSILDDGAANGQVKA